MKAADNPLVSVIVPARNEEACLAVCLESLVSQIGIAFELIVVDDASTDRTGEIARSFVDVPTGVDVRPRVTVISAPPLPENWTGKNNAMSAGARIAKGKWLLFTDADTFHRPGALARAVAEVEDQGAALLSYSPEQEVHGFWEKAVMPVIFAELAATYPPKMVNDPASPIAAANGQYLMISREAYDAVGGHAAIANNLLEDVAIARLVKASGRRIFFRYGGDAVRTRMYRSFAQMKAGWTKNLALLFPKPAELARHRFGEFVLMPFAACIFVWGLSLKGDVGIPYSHYSHFWLRWYMLVLVGWAFVASLVRFVRRIRAAHIPWLSIPRAYPGLAVFAYLLLRSERAYKRSKFDWKGRTYVYTPEEVKAWSGVCSAPGRGES